MPFRSEAQRRYLWQHEPAIARRWTDESGATPQPRTRVTARDKRVALLQRMQKRDRHG